MYFVESKVLVIDIGCSAEKLLQLVSELAFRLCVASVKLATTGALTAKEHTQKGKRAF